jgi:hypothetical protein
MLPQNLILVDIREELRDMRRHRCEYGGDFRTPARRGEERIRVISKEVATLPERSSKTKDTPPEEPIPGIAGGAIEKAVPSGIAESF